MKTQAAHYLRYSPAVETIHPGEEEVFQELTDTMLHITRTMASHYRHAYRPVHAKSHGLLVGKLTVPGDLPEMLAHGLFAQAASYPAILRFSTNPGDLLADSVSSPRGLAVKVLNVPGEMLPSHEGSTTQDFVCVNAKVFGAADPAAFLAGLKTLDKTLEYPDALKQAVSTASRLVNLALRAVGVHSGLLDSFGHPFTHILGETYSTVGALRYGSYVAKIAIEPASRNLRALTGKHVDAGKGFNPLEDAVREFFAANNATWNIRAQFALDSDTTPIEDLSKEWPEDLTPFQTVAVLTVEAQDSYSDARQVFVDEQLSFSPWHGLAAHQPLGGIMRSRRAAYEAAQKFRAQRNMRPRVEPFRIEEVPR